jgi:phosphonate transport system permease protein
MADRSANASSLPRIDGLLPSRFAWPSPLRFVLYVAVAAFLIASIDGVDISLGELVEGIPSIGRMIGQMFPPNFTRIGPILLSLLETFQMAVVGTVFGVLFSLPLAVLAARSQTPHIVAYHVARAFISLFRTVPDLIWALLFVVAVGLGPFAGALALMVDTMGFCGRFFAESMEEADKGPQEALTALGATRLGRICCAVVPAAFPSFINTSLFSLEKATRSSVVLGLVGAGGIGIELKVAMDLFDYDQAATMILCVFILVVAVEQASALLRRHII